MEEPDDEWASKIEWHRVVVNSSYWIAWYVIAFYAEPRAGTDSKKTPS